MSITLGFTSAPFLGCGTKLKIRSESGDSDNMKCKRGSGGAYGGVWQCLHLSGIWSQVVGSVLARLAGRWLQSP